MINIKYTLSAGKRTKNRQPFVNKKNNWLMIFIYGILGGIIITTLLLVIFDYVKTSPKLINKHKKAVLSKPLPKLTEHHTNNKDNKKSVNNYDFYNLLPNAQTSANNVNDSNKYLLQIGSFPHIQQADELKAKLALQGFEAKIETIAFGAKKIPNYKVIIGPFSSQQIAITKKTQLDSAGFKNTVIKNI